MCLPANTVMETLRPLSQAAWLLQVNKTTDDDAVEIQQMCHELSSEQVVQMYLNTLPFLSLLCIHLNVVCSFRLLRSSTHTLLLMILRSELHQHLCVKFRYVLFFLLFLIHIHSNQRMGAFAFYLFYFYRHCCRNVRVHVIWWWMLSIAFRSLFHSAHPRKRWRCCRCLVALTSVSSPAYK